MLRSRALQNSSCLPSAHRPYSALGHRGSMFSAWFSHACGSQTHFQSSQIDQRTFAGDSNSTPASNSSTSSSSCSSPCDHPTESNESTPTASNERPLHQQHANSSTASFKISRGHSPSSLLMSTTTALLLLLSSSLPAALSQSGSVPQYAVDFTQVRCLVACALSCAPSMNLSVFTRCVGGVQCLLPGMRHYPCIANLRR